MWLTAETIARSEAETIDSWSPTPQTSVAVPGVDLDVGRRGGVGAGAHRVLGVVDDLAVEETGLAQRHGRTRRSGRCPRPVIIRSSPSMIILASSVVRPLSMVSLVARWPTISTFGDSGSTYSLMNRRWIS